MKIGQAMKMALASIFSNKMRSFLTMLGIIIGVLSVTMLVSLVQGATGSITESLDELGGSKLTITITNNKPKLTLHELKELEEQDKIDQVAPYQTGKATATAVTNATDVTIMGITEAYTGMQNLKIEQGRSILDVDNEYRLNVCMIGQNVAHELFGTLDVMGSEIRILGRDYRIVGVLEGDQEHVINNKNDHVYLPLTNAQRLLKSSSIHTFLVTAESDQDLEQAQKAVSQFLLERYKTEDSYTMINMADILDTINSILSTMTLMLGGIAGISLLVGGIGIMNIMLVSVTERIKEIGIRKAIGAQRQDILMQFLIESMMLSLLGGLIGLLMTMLLLQILNGFFPDYHFAVSVGVGGGAMIFSMVVGIVFGLYPANKAAKLKPIDALRFE